MPVAIPYSIRPHGSHLEVSTLCKSCARCSDPKRVVDSTHGLFSFLSVSISLPPLSISRGSAPECAPVAKAYSGTHLCSQQYLHNGLYPLERQHRRVNVRVQTVVHAFCVNYLLPAQSDDGDHHKNHPTNQSRHCKDRSDAMDSDWPFFLN